MVRAMQIGTLSGVSSFGLPVPSHSNVRVMRKRENRQERMRREAV